MHLLKVENLSVYYRTRSSLVKAVDDVSLILNQGCCLGIVGESGCGKTSFILALTRLLPDNAQTEGKVLFLGADLLGMPEDEFRKNYRWKKISMIFQNSMSALNPVFKIKKQFVDAIKLHEDVDEKEAFEKTVELLKMVGLRPSIADQYPHQLSGGMKQRVMIALSLICNPKLLIADEPTTALDVIVQSQILEIIRQLHKKLSITFIVVSHDIAVVFETCERIAVMYGGDLVEIGNAVSIYKEPRHPYTAALLKAFPRISGDVQPLVTIPGNPPDLRKSIKGCKFEPRCIFAQSICKENKPTFEEIENEHFSLCHFAKKGGFEW